VKRTILHFSDLHFGEAHAPDRAEGLLEAVKRTQPTVVAVSGDLTRRARPREFRDARDFLARIDRPLVVVPGNHDVPLWNPVARFFSPLKRWHRDLGRETTPFYADETIAIQGIDTTRSLTFSGGRITGEDLEPVRARLCALPAEVCKVVVAHHPFVIPPGARSHGRVAGAEEALVFFESCAVDVVLTGHLHHAHAGSSRELFPRLKRHIVLVQAGTATTLRGRGHERDKNSFNLIEVTPTTIQVTPLVYGEEGFAAAETASFERHPAGGVDHQKT
jgi:3',5'-cyclic AMP phosphodiesterase CpdA